MRSRPRSRTAGRCCESRGRAQDLPRPYTSTGTPCRGACGSCRAHRSPPTPRRARARPASDASSPARRAARAHRARRWAAPRNSHRSHPVDRRAGEELELGRRGPQGRGGASDDRGVPSLAHRGLWTLPAERNSLAAIRDAFASGWGVETDVRDIDGTLVVSHDPPGLGTLPFAAVVDAYREYGCPGALAVNVKADGLPAMLADALRDVDRDRWFAFDMSVPDMRQYAREG